MGATTLKVTSKGQLTLCKDLLAHLGIQPGQRLDVQVLPGGAGHRFHSGLHWFAGRPLEAIHQLLADPALAKAMGVAGSTHVRKHFDTSFYRQQLIRLLTSQALRRGARPCAD